MPGHVYRGAPRAEERADAFVAAMASHVGWKWHAPVDWESCPSSGC
jgi:hypothetical protein